MSEPVSASWPTSDDGTIVFDLDWLDRGTAVSVTEAEEEAIQYVFRTSDLFADHISSRVRTECYRRRGIHRFGRNFLHQPPEVLRAGDVRGLFYLEWDAHVAHMQRTGHLEPALALVYEVIDAAERVDAIEGRGAGAVGWYKRAAIILRKLGGPRRRGSTHRRCRSPLSRAHRDRISIGDRYPSSGPIALTLAVSVG